MKILAVDSSAQSASVAVVEGDKLLSESYVNIGLTHSETLMPMVDSVLRNAMLSISDIDRLCVTVGPGSFTGIRIGVAAVKGLAEPNKTPCAPVSTLAAMAYVAEDAEGILCCAMDARCGQVYTALFSVHKKVVKRLTQDIAISLQELYNILKEYEEPITFLGDGAEICCRFFEGKLANIKLSGGLLRYQRAYGAVLAALACEEDIFVAPDLVVPVYLRPPQAERELKKKKEEKQV